MRPLRSALIAAALSLLWGCGPEDECFKARSGDEAECTVFEGTAEWTLSPDQPIADLERMCAASCIDVPRAPILVAGYSDLREAPLLAKFRNIQRLRIDVARLVDLRGLERVNVIEFLDFQHVGAQRASFRSLDGLGDREVMSISFRGWTGLDSFDGSRFDELLDFSTDNAALRVIDLSTQAMRSISVVGEQELTSLQVGTGTMKGLSIMATSLTEFSWKPGLKIQSIYVAQNESLSSCLVDDFVADTRASPVSSVVAANNGPCP